MMGFAETSILLPFNARTRVHEYGGGDYTVFESTVYFSNFADQRIYRQLPNGQPTAVTPDRPMRYAEPIVDAKRSRLICVREDHSDSSAEAKNAIVSVSTESAADEQKVLASGNDFYSSPKLSPDGTQLAWLTWNHPNMPWDGCELWVGEFADEGDMVATQKGGWR